MASSAISRRESTATEPRPWLRLVTRVELLHSATRQSSIPQRGPDRRKALIVFQPGDQCAFETRRHFNETDAFRRVEDSRRMAIFRTRLALRTGLLAAASLPILQSVCKCTAARRAATCQTSLSQRLTDAAVKS